MSSRLLRYHDENIRHARRPVLHIFPGKFCRPLHIRAARCVDQCRSTPKAVQSVQIGTHLRYLKVELISNYNCHIRAQRPIISKELTSETVRLMTTATASPSIIFCLRANFVWYVR